MMWKTKNVYTGIFDSQDGIEKRFLKNVPDWPAFDKFAHGWIPRFVFAGAYTAFYIAFAPNWFCFLLLPIHYAISPVHGAVINWYAHKYGYTNFKMDNTSENLFHVDVLMLGESYHNNHHKHPSSVNFGVKWHEIDPIYPITLLFDKMGIIQINPANRKKGSQLLSEEHNSTPEVELEEAYAEEEY